MKRRHWVLAWFASLAILTYFDRLCIAIAGPRMQAELGFSPGQWGWIVGVFALSYGVMEVPTGAWGDRYGQRMVITRIVLWWSVFMALTGSVGSFALLIVVRLLFGAGEAGAFPNMAGALSRWFPPVERARAQGAVWSASRIGGVLSPLILVPMMQWLGWRAMFWALGVAGVLWVAAWRPWYRDSPDGAVKAADHGAVPWGALFRSRTLWRVMAMYGTYGWGGYFYLSWLHTYLVKSRGFSEKEMGLFSTLPFVLGACANIAGGWLSDALVRRYGLRDGRRWLGAASLAGGAVCILATALTEGKTSGIVLISVGYGFMDMMLPSAWAVCLDIGGRYAGAVSGAMNTCAQFGGFTCSVLFGYVAERYGYNAPLLLIAVMVGLSAYLFYGVDASRAIGEERERG